MKQMLCPIQNSEHAEILLDYCARRLSADVREQVDRHMSACTDCRDFIAGQQMLWDTLDAWEAMAVPEQFDRKLEQRIALAGQNSGIWLALKNAVWRPSVPLAAVCGGVLAILLTPAPVIEQPLPAAAEVREVEQVERTLEDLDMLWQLGPPLPADKHT